MENLNVIELATDAIALIFRTMSWMLFVWGPIAALVTCFVIGAQQNFPLWQLAIVGLILAAVFIGIAILSMWLSTGLINRYRKRMIFVSVLISLAAFITFFGIFFLDIRLNSAIISQSIQTAFLFGSGIIVFLSAIKPRKNKKQNAHH